MLCSYEGPFWTIFTTPPIFTPTHTQQALLMSTYAPIQARVQAYTHTHTPYAMNTCTLVSRHAGVHAYTHMHRHATRNATEHAYIIHSRMAAYPHARYRKLMCSHPCIRACIHTYTRHLRATRTSHSRACVNYRVQQAHATILCAHDPIHTRTHAGKHTLDMCTQIHIRAHIHPHVNTCHT